AHAGVGVDEIVPARIVERGQVLELVVEVQRIDGGPVHRVGQPRGGEFLGPAVLEVFVDPRHTGLGREVELGPFVPLVAHPAAVGGWGLGLPSHWYPPPTRGGSRTSSSATSSCSALKLR